MCGFYGMIENIDDNMGKLMKQLESWKMEENTLLIFMTDNGSTAGFLVMKEKEQQKFFFNAGMKGFKNSHREGATRVPAFWRWKNKLKADVEVETLTAHIDILPTLAKLAGAEIPSKQVEGRDLMPLLKNPKVEWDDRYVFTHVGRWKRFTDPELAKFKQCAVRNERFRFENNRQLFDLQADPGQKINVVEDYPEVVEKMQKAYDKWWAETVPLMVNEKAEFDGPHPYIDAYNKQKSSGGIPKWVRPTLTEK